MKTTQTTPKTPEPSYAWPNYRCPDLRANCLGNCKHVHVHGRCNPSDRRHAEGCCCFDDHS